MQINDEAMTWIEEQEMDDDIK